jgi:hypothetical protein
MTFSPAIGHSDECSTEMVIDQQAVDSRLSQIDAQARDRVNQ